MKNDILTSIFGTLSASTILVDFQSTIDTAWKIIGIISGVIAIICFTKESIHRIKVKILKAKNDGVITKEEAKDIISESINDAKTIIDMTKQLTNNDKEE